jgi:uncharacterized protein YcfJ
MDSKIPASPTNYTISKETVITKEYTPRNQFFFTGVGCFLGGFIVSAASPSILGAILGGYIGSKIGESMDGGVYKKRTVITTTENLPSCSQENSDKPKVE